MYAISICTFSRAVSPITKLWVIQCNKNSIRWFSKNSDSSSSLGVNKLWKFECGPNQLIMLQNAKITQVASEHLYAQSAKFKSVHFDLGTGDGKFVYREALKNPDTFFVGVDCNPSAMQRLSWKVARKPARGGVNNAAFMVSSIENLPPAVKSMAEYITINYPWGSLLRDLVLPQDQTLHRISKLARGEGKLDIALNYDVFENISYIAKLNLPKVDENFIQTHLKPRYADCSIIIQDYKIQNCSLGKSTWGQHLTLGSQRKVLNLHCFIRP